MGDFVRSFSELTLAEQPSAGGKGGTLARLYQAGYPVPDGFVILPTAFVDDELQGRAWVQVQAHLERLRQVKGEIAFAVRSSGLSEDSSLASFASSLAFVTNWKVGSIRGSSTNPVARLCFVQRNYVATRPFD